MMQTVVSLLTLFMKVSFVVTGYIAGQTQILSATSVRKFKRKTIVRFRLLKRLSRKSTINSSAEEKATCYDVM